MKAVYGCGTGGGTAGEGPVSGWRSGGLTRVIWSDLVATGKLGGSARGGRLHSRSGGTVSRRLNLAVSGGMMRVTVVGNVVGQSKWVRLFFVGGPEGSRAFCKRHGKSYLTRRRRGEEGGGGGSVTGGAFPPA